MIWFVSITITLFVFFVFSLKVAWWRKKTPANIPLVLMLHAVNDAIVEAECPNNSIRPSELKALILKLKKHGYKFATLEEASANPERRTCVLTFDDGFIDNYINLFPILKETGAKATLFVTSRFETSPAEFLSPDQLREMDMSGLVEIGGHTASHVKLTDITDSSLVRQEIAENKKWIEAALGHDISSFAYPKGGENEEIVEIVKSVGYKRAAAMVKGLRPFAADVWRIHRQIIPRGLKPWQAYFVATRGRYKA